MIILWYFKRVFVQSMQHDKSSYTLFLLDLTKKKQKNLTKLIII
jgi:hypothetical protein